MKTVWDQVKDRNRELIWNAAIEAAAQECEAQMGETCDEDTFSNNAYGQAARAIRALKKETK